MKKAIAYIRISTAEQSNFSLSGQREHVTAYCQRQGYELLNVFEDNGQSAKNFDRANWQVLEAFVKENYRNIDYLVVAKYDRFSRNISEALQMIEKLESKYNIVVLSVMEDVKLHPKSSMFFLMRTQMLLYAENEYRVLKERTKMGMHQAAKQGRYLHGAPFGYKNSRDAANMPVIVIDTERAFIVKKAFELCLSGMPLEEIRRAITPLGYTGKGKSAIPRMLANHTYAGLVKVPADYDGPEYLTEGLHEGIIDKSTFYQVQAIISGRGINRKIIDANVPLRGVLRCECGHPFTAAASKGRSRYYNYYKCNNHNGSNYNADKLHSQFHEILQIISLPPAYVAAIKKQLADRIASDMLDVTKELEARQRNLKEVQTKLDRLQEKYILDEISKDVYSKFQSQWLKEKYSTEATIADLQRPAGEVWQRYEDTLQGLSNLANIYDAANVYQKQGFIQIGFDNQLSYSGGVYRTGYMLPLFMPKLATLKEKGLLYYQQPLSVLGNNSRSAPHTPPLEPLLKLLQWLQATEAA